MQYNLDFGERNILWNTLKFNDEVLASIVVNSHEIVDIFGKKVNTENSSCGDSKTILKR